MLAWQSLRGMAAMSRQMFLLIQLDNADMYLPTWVVIGNLLIKKSAVIGNCLGRPNGIN